ncbi:MAG: hypothetical protein R6V31_10670 [Halohasta sp.]
MSDKRREACGRCSLSTVVETVDEAADRDPFGDERIEVEEATLRQVAPAAWMQRVTRRLDELARRLTYDR